MNFRNNRNSGSDGAKRTSFIPRWLIIVAVILIINIVMSIFRSAVSSGNYTLIGYNQFVKLVEGGYVEQVQIEDNQVLFTLQADADTEEVDSILYSDAAEDADSSKKESLSQQMSQLIGQTQVYYTGRVEDPGLIERLMEYDIDFYSPIEQESSWLSSIFSWVVYFGIMLTVYYLFFRMVTKRMGGGTDGGILGAGKSKAKLYTVERSTGVSFTDVAGQEEAKESLRELVDYLHNPQKYQQIGAKQPKGALLVGPPGTGKTLLAKAVAGEARVPFFSLSGSEFVEMFVGVGASRVRDLFAQANKQAPCIIFIDEIDAIGKKRDSQLGTNDEREQTLNQLLNEMDGFDSAKGIIVLAATNRPEILDAALLRPGRFDRRIIVEKPDLPGRESILKVHADKISLGDDVDLKQIAKTTSGATGADLANIVNEAALRAVRLGRRFALQEDMLDAVETVIAGKEKKDRILSAKEKQMVAFHEAGHALVSTKNGRPIQKITIVPRTLGSLGFTMNAPDEEKYLTTRSELINQIEILLAGRAAEEIVFGEVSTGAKNDLEQATKLARSMVSQYGMGENIGLSSLEEVQNQYLGGRSMLTCSEGTGTLIDAEVKLILQSCYDTAKEILDKNREFMKIAANALIDRESLTGAEFMSLLDEEQSITA